MSAPTPMQVVPDREMVRAANDLMALATATATVAVVGTSTATDVSVTSATAIPAPDVAVAAKTKLASALASIQTNNYTEAAGILRSLIIDTGLVCIPALMLLRGIYCALPGLAPVSSDPTQSTMIEALTARISGAADATKQYWTQNYIDHLMARAPTSITNTANITVATTATKAELTLCGLWYTNIIKNHDVAARLFLAASTADDQSSAVNSIAQIGLAKLYHDAQGVRYDLSRIFELLTAAADQGNVSAQYCLGIYYKYGRRTISEILVKAQAAYDKAIADVVALNNVLERSVRVCPSALAKLQTARDDSTKLVENLHCALKDISRTAATTPDFTDIAQAVYHFETAAVRDCREAQYELADIYMVGRGSVQQDFTKAVPWLRRAAHRHHKAAAFKLACCYAHGEGIAKNLTLARQWVLLSARLGYAPAVRSATTHQAAAATKFTRPIQLV